MLQYKCLNGITYGINLCCCKLGSPCQAHQKMIYIPYLIVQFLLYIHTPPSSNTRFPLFQHVHGHAVLQQFITERLYKFVTFTNQSNHKLRDTVIEQGSLIIHPVRGNQNNIYKHWSFDFKCTAVYIRLNNLSLGHVLFFCTRGDQDLPALMFLMYFYLVGTIVTTQQLKCCRT